MHIIHARLLAALLILLGLAWAVPGVRPAQAQAPPAPLTLEVRAGLDGDGRYRVGHWFPVTIIAANDSGDLRGALEWRFAGSSEPAFRHELDLPRGARKALSIPIVTMENNRAATVALVADGVELATTRVRLNPLVSEQVAVGVLSSSDTLLNSLGAAQLVNTLPTMVVQLDEGLLPDDAALLGGLDVIFIHDLVTADLTDAQRAALELWTRMGGILVVGGGPPAAQTTPGLAAILPVEVGALRPGVSLAPLEGLAGEANLAGSLPTATVSAVTLRPGASSLDQGQLLVAGNLGAGQVIFAAFDLAATRAWGGEVSLWTRALSLNPRMQIGQSFRWRSENLLSDALNLPALQLPSTGLLLLLMAAYIGVVGPLNFLTLRRMGRMELAWVTTPLLVAGFLAASYGASFVLRGTQPQLLQLAMVQGFEGSDRGQRTAFVGVFSPQRRSYRLDFGPTSLLTPGSFEGWQFRSLPVTLDGTSAGVADLLVDVSALRTLLVEQPATDLPGLESRLERQDDRLVGELRLSNDLALRDAILVRGADAQLLGDLAAGEAVSVDLSIGQFNFPDQIGLSEDGVIRRTQVLNSLFSYDRFAIGGPQFGGAKGMPDSGAYLLGWGEHPSVEVQIDGTRGNQQGETLYLIWLATGN